MKLLVDTNIVLDVVLKRGEWAMEAARLLSVIEEGRADGYVTGHSVEISSEPAGAVLAQL